MRRSTSINGRTCSASRAICGPSTCKTEERLQWMALPRAAALAEVGWSAAPRRRWPDFLDRLVPMLARYRAFGLNYADSVFAPGAAISPAAAGFTVRLSNQAQSDAAFGDIRYTLDGREPSAQSTAYDDALDGGSRHRAARGGVRGNRRRLRARRCCTSMHSSALRRDSHELDLCSDGVGLLLEPAGAATSVAVDIMNPCWIERGVDLSAGPRLLPPSPPCRSTSSSGRRGQDSHRRGAHCRGRTRSARRRLRHARAGGVAPRRGGACDRRDGPAGAAAAAHCRAARSVPTLRTAAAQSAVGAGLDRDRGVAGECRA